MERRHKIGRSTNGLRRRDVANLRKRLGEQSVQRNCRNCVQDARKEAEGIVAAARRQANAIIAEAHKAAAEIKDRAGSFEYFIECMTSLKTTLNGNKPK